MQGYGMTEVSPLCFISHKGSTNYSSIGWPTSGTEAKIVNVSDDTFSGLDLGESGELLVRNQSIMKGYLNNVEATENTVINGNWLRTGDIAKYDENGFFYITDRLKELIKVKGFQVSPAELEEIIRSNPKVLDAGVIGIDHPKHGEVPRAFVVAKPDSGLTEKELQDFVASKVAEYKRLRGGVQFCAEIPKSGTGKILRKTLRLM